MDLKEKWRPFDSEFKAIFGESVFVFADYWLLQTGWLVFDILKFEKYMSCKGYDVYCQSSLAQFVEKKYGMRARELIQQLLS